MTPEERQEILTKSKDFFRNRIIVNHKRNTAKLSTLKNFNVNPFMCKYLSAFAFGDASPENIAKSLIYPRALGTSITTSFGNQMQYFCNDVLTSYASTTSGIDIEFTDAIDGQYKYCQLKAGPQTINNDDIKTITDHFKDLRNLARTNGKRIATEDCIVGVFYGTEKDLSANYKKIDEEYPVIAGQDFWYHLTGDPEFYGLLINAFVEVAIEIDGSDLMTETVSKLAEDIKNNGL